VNAATRTDAHHPHRKRKAVQKRYRHPSLAPVNTVTPKRSKAQHADGIDNTVRRSPRLTTVQAADDDNDVFQPVKARPRIKIAAHKHAAGAPLKRQLLSTIQESEELEPKPGKTCCRCNPKDVIDAINLMSGPQKEKIRDLGWGKILDITIDAVKRRELFKWLLTKVDVLSMEIRVPPHTILPITKHAVHIVLGVPTGTRPPSDHSYKEVNEEKARLATALGCQGNRITIARLKSKLSEHKVDDLSIRCFFLLLFNRLLFSTSAFDISNTEVKYTMDWDSFDQVDWQQIMVNDIRDAAKQWMGCKSDNPSFSSYPPFLIIYYLDNLLHKANNENRMITPRAATFTKEKVGTLMLADRWKDEWGNTHYGALPQKNQKGSAYETQPTTHAGPSTSLAAPSFDIPVLRNLLQGHTGVISGNAQTRITDLAAAFDEDMRQLNQSISKRMHKFADDITSLLSDVPASTALDETRQGHHNQCNTVGEELQRNANVDESTISLPSYLLRVIDSIA